MAGEQSDRFAVSEQFRFIGRTFTEYRWLFDLALSSNFLFLYDDRLDLEFHLDSLRELPRVADEVRIFPLASLNAERSAYVGPVVEQLRSDGYGAEFQSVPYEFQPGVTEMLVVSDEV